MSYRWGFSVVVEGSQVKEYQKNPSYVREKAETYVNNKTDDSQERQQIFNRAVEYGKKSVEIGDDLYSRFDELDISIDIESSSAEDIKKEFTQKLTDKIGSQLENQESKKQNAEIFIAFITDRVVNSVLDGSEDLTSEEKQEKLEGALKLASMAVEAISDQDLAANAVTLGDHGWHHLYQDMRDSLLLARGLSEDNQLSNNEELLLVLSAAFHDIGYSSPEVSDYQQETSANYGLDKGHPLLSFTFLRQNAEKFLKVIDEEEFEALCTIVVNHENPERADEVGEKYSHLSKALSHADAAASVGPEKVPPIIPQEPGVLSYAFLLNQGSAARDEGLITDDQYEKLIANAKQNVTDSLEQSGKYDQDQADKLLNVFTDTHLSKHSLKFILGRLTGEMGPISVFQSESGTKKIDLEMNLGEAAKVGEFLPGATEAGAKLAVKVFGEQAGISWSDDDKENLTEYLLNAENHNPLVLDGIDVVATRENGSVVLESPSIRLFYNPDKQADQHKDFYDKIIQALEQGQSDLAKAINENYANERAQ